MKNDTNESPESSENQSDLQKHLSKLHSDFKAISKHLKVNTSSFKSKKFPKKSKASLVKYRLPCTCKKTCSRCSYIQVPKIVPLKNGKKIRSFDIYRFPAYQSEDPRLLGNIPFNYLDQMFMKPKVRSRVYRRFLKLDSSRRMNANMNQKLSGKKRELKNLDEEIESTVDPESRKLLQSKAKGLKREIKRLKREIKEKGKTRVSLYTGDEYIHHWVRKSSMDQLETGFHFLTFDFPLKLKELYLPEISTRPWFKDCLHLDTLEALKELSGSLLEHFGQWKGISLQEGLRRVFLMTVVRSLRRHLGENFYLQVHEFGKVGLPDIHVIFPVWQVVDGKHYHLGNGSIPEERLKRVYEEAMKELIMFIEWAIKPSGWIHESKKRSPVVKKWRLKCKKDITEVFPLSPDQYHQKKEESSEVEDKLRYLNNPPFHKVTDFKFSVVTGRVDLFYGESSPNWLELPVFLTRVFGEDGRKTTSLKPFHSGEFSKSGISPENKMTFEDVSMIKQVMWYQRRTNDLEYFDALDETA